MGASGMELRSYKWNKMQGENIVIAKKGQLYKQSKYLRDWRKRTVVIANGHIISFNQTNEPTLLIKISEISNLLKQEEDNSFLLKILTNNNQIVLFKTKDEYQRDEWFSQSEKIRMMKESCFSAGHIVNQGDQSHIFQQVRPQKL